MDRRSARPTTPVTCHDDDDHDRDDQDHDNQDKDHDDCKEHHGDPLSDTMQVMWSQLGRQ